MEAISNTQKLGCELRYPPDHRNYTLCQAISCGKKMENGGISSYLNLHLYIICICMTYTYYTYWCTVVKRTGHHPLVWLASHVWGVFSSWRHSDDIRDWSQFHLPWYKINVYDAMIHGITVKLIDECHSTVSYSFFIIHDIYHSRSHRNKIIGIVFHDSSLFVFVIMRLYCPRFYMTWYVMFWRVFVISNIYPTFPWCPMT